jgi:hypothetical protein
VRHVACRICKVLIIGTCNACVQLILTVWDRERLLTCRGNCQILNAGRLGWLQAHETPQHRNPTRKNEIRWLTSLWALRGAGCSNERLAGTEHAPHMHCTTSTDRITFHLLMARYVFNGTAARVDLRMLVVMRPELSR